MALASPDYSVLAGHPDEGLVTGIIRNVGIGRPRDVSLPVLWFDVYISESTSQVVTLSWDDAHDIVGRFEDIRSMAGYPCWCDVATPGVIKFVRLWDRFGG